MRGREKNPGSKGERWEKEKSREFLWVFACACARVLMTGQ